MPQSVSAVGLAQRGVIPRKQFYTKLCVSNIVILVPAPVQGQRQIAVRILLQLRGHQIRNAGVRHVSKSLLFRRDFVNDTAARLPHAEHA